MESPSWTLHLVLKSPGGVLEEEWPLACATTEDAVRRAFDDVLDAAERVAEPYRCGACQVCADAACQVCGDEEEDEEEEEEEEESD